MADTEKRRRISKVSIGEVSLVQKGAVPGSDFVVLTKEDASVDEIDQVTELLKSIDELTVEQAGPIVQLIKDHVGIDIYHSEWDEDTEPEVSVRLRTTMDKLSGRMADLESAVETVASTMKVEKDDLNKAIEEIKVLVKRDDPATELKDGDDEVSDTTVVKEDEQVIDPLAKAVEIMRERKKLRKADSTTLVVEKLALATSSMSSLTERLDGINSSLARACGRDT
jgi:hypothetical protein